MSRQAGLWLDRIATKPDHR